MIIKKAQDIKYTMSTCSHPNCNSTTNLWIISSQSTVPPCIKDFIICNEHLFKNQKLNAIQQAILVARYNGNFENTINQNDYKMEKIVETWSPVGYKCTCCEKKSGSTVGCSICGSHELLWLVGGKSWVHDEQDCYPYGYFQSFEKCFCNNHVGKNKPFINNDEYNYLKTVESTWMQVGNQSVDRCI